MHIIHGHKIGAESVYSMVYFAISATMELLTHTQTLHANACDAKQVLGNIPDLRRKLQNIYKDQ